MGSFLGTRNQEPAGTVIKTELPLLGTRVLIPVQELRTHWLLRTAKKTEGEKEAKKSYQCSDSHA